MEVIAMCYLGSVIHKGKKVLCQILGWVDF